MRDLGIVLDYEQEKLVLRSQYDADLVTSIKQIPGRKWDKERKVWTFPRIEIGTLTRKLQPWSFVFTPIAKCFYDEQEGRRRRLLDLKFAHDVSFHHPQLRVELRPFQRVGASFLAEVGRGLLADDMGLGKTIMSTSAALKVGAERVLVLCPATLKGNWIRELSERFDGLNIIHIHGDKKERASAWNASEVEGFRGFVVANYELLIHDWDTMPRQWDCIIADEVTRIKNWKAQKTKNMKKLKATHRFGLSGTPIENNLSELHSIMDWIEPGLLGAGYLFVQEYVEKDQFGRHVGYKNLDRVQSRISLYYLRRKKEDVLEELPPKVSHPVFVELSAKERAEYNRLSGDFESWIRREARPVYANALERLIRLKQYVDHPKLLDKQEASSKMTELQSILDELDGHKVVVFTQFVPMAEILAGELLHGRAFMMTGKHTPIPRRQPIVDEFGAVEGSALLVMSEIGAHGLNITAADYIIHYDYPWNPAVLRQREDRLHRMGQRQTVNVIYLKAAQTIDEYIWDVLYGKEQFAEQFFQEAEQIASDMVVKRLTIKDMVRLARGV